MYTLDQQIKDVDRALEMLHIYKEEGDNLFLCHIAKDISKDFYDFIVRAFKRMDKISPKVYRTTIANPLYFSIDKYGTSPALWEHDEYQCRKQFLKDLKEDIIENG